MILKFEEEINRFVKKKESKHTYGEVAQSDESPILILEKIVMFFVPSECLEIVEKIFKKAISFFLN